LFCCTNSLEKLKALSNYKNIEILFDWICKLLRIRKKEARIKMIFTKVLLFKFGAYRLRKNINEKDKHFSQKVKNFSQYFVTIEKWFISP